MSYDIRIRVKAEGCDKYPVVAIPERDSPTYNFRNMFVACMDWDYTQGDCYKLDFAIEKIEHGIKELTYNRKKYEKYNPENGWGSLETALKCLQSVRECIYETTKSLEIPLEYLYMSW